MTPIKKTSALLCLLAMCAGAAFADAPALDAPTISTAICEDRVANPDTHFTNQPAIELAGTATPALIVALSEGGAEIGRTTAAADGAWKFSAIYAEAAHQVLVVTIDAEGNSSAGETCNFTVDLTAPQAPHVDGTDGTLLPPRSIQTGESEPGLVRVFEDQSLLAETLSDGTFSTEVLLFNGTHTLSFAAIDRAGNVSNSVSTRTVEVDGIAPTITVTVDDNHLFLEGESVVFDGTAHDERTLTRVSVRYFDVTGKTVAMRDALCIDCGTKDAEWRDQPQLLPGVYKVEASAFDAMGNRSVIARRTFVAL